MKWPARRHNLGHRGHFFALKAVLRDDDGVIR